MKKILFVLGVKFLICFPTIGQIDTLALTAIVQNAIASNAFEGTVLVAENGLPVFTQSFGFKDQEMKNAVLNNSHYSIASITKLFTAIVILQLVEEGSISLTDNLETLLPEFPINNADKISIHHLLLHISGLPNESDSIYLRYMEPRSFVLATLENQGGELGDFNYANIDYILLGLIIEKYDRKPWQQAIRSRILDRVNMSETGFLQKNNYPKDFAFSFTIDDQNIRRSDPLLFIENYYAAGCMYSTAADLLRLDHALYNNDLLSNKSKELMYTSYPEFNYSGYSVWTYNYPFSNLKSKIMERRGGILGANVVLIRFLETHRTIVILSNNNKFNSDSFGDLNSLKEALIIAVDQ